MVWLGWDRQLASFFHSSPARAAAFLPWSGAAARGVHARTRGSGGCWGSLCLPGADSRPLEGGGCSRGAALALAVLLLRALLRAFAARRRPPLPGAPTALLRRAHIPRRPTRRRGAAEGRGACARTGGKGTRPLGKASFSYPPQRRALARRCAPRRPSRGVGRAALAHRGGPAWRAKPAGAQLSCSSLSALLAALLVYTCGASCQCEAAVKASPRPVDALRGA